MSHVQVIVAPPRVEVVSWKQTAPRRYKGKGGCNGNALGKIIHPIMLECAECCGDSRWERIFRRAAGGKLPSHFALKEDRLSVKIRKKITSIALPSDVVSASEVFKNFVIQYDSIYGDAKNTKPDPDTGKNSLAKNLAHRRRFRRNMLKRFITNAVGPLATDVQHRFLAFSVHMGFQLNYLKSKDIVVNDAQTHVVSIAGLSFSQHHQRMDLEPHKFVVPANKRRPKDKSQLANVDHVMSTYITRRFESKRQAVNPPSIATALDELLNLRWVTLASE